MATLSEEQILENAAKDGSMDVYEGILIPFHRIRGADMRQNRMASRAGKAAATTS